MADKFIKHTAVVLISVMLLTVLVDAVQYCCTFSFHHETEDVVEHDHHQNQAQSLYQHKHNHKQLVKSEELEQHCPSYIDESDAPILAIISSESQDVMFNSHSLSLLPVVRPVVTTASQYHFIERRQSLYLQTNRFRV